MSPAPASPAAGRPEHSTLVVGLGVDREDLVREAGLDAMASSRCRQESGISSLSRSSARRSAMRAASGLPRPSMSASCL